MGRAMLSQIVAVGTLMVPIIYVVYNAFHKVSMLMPL